MSETDTRSTKVLYKEWRQGDAEAGQIMAQRFADWYYAIATSRLGEADGGTPTENACSRFGAGIVEVTDPRQLVPWAHNIIQEEMQGNARVGDGDEPNAYTGGMRPKGLLARARTALPEQMSLLERVYRTGSTEQVEPLDVLRARYAIKKYLRDNANVPFEVAPDDPILDRAPMPLYESGRMATPEEEANFEQWMISDINLCKDIAEFAHFAIALRGGLPSEDQFEAEQEARKAKRTGTPAPQDRIVPDNDGGGAGKAAALAGGGLLVVGGIGVVALIAIGVLVYMFVL